LQHCAQTHNHQAEKAIVDQKISQLTPREREVMHLVVAGKLNKIIADQLGVSTRTVEIHRARIMEKMEAKSLSQLVRMVLKSEAENAQ
jgi:two-component system, LuxR family, response regulator FixJ